MVQVTNHCRNCQLFALDLPNLEVKIGVTFERTFSPGNFFLSLVPKPAWARAVCGSFLSVEVETFDEAGICIEAGVESTNMERGSLRTSFPLAKLMLCIVPASSPSGISIVTEFFTVEEPAFAKVGLGIPLLSGDGLLSVWIGE